ncbi:MAG: T9SS type A sorting domain-containing protein, partial [Flavobacteriales bacterium]
PGPDQPLIVLTESPDLCEGGSTTMVATAEAGVTYQWTVNGENIPGATASQHTVSTPGEYTLIITDANGCSATAVEGPTVVVNPLPNAPVVTLDFDVLSASGPGTFQWSFNGEPIDGATDADLTASSNGVYTVTTTNENGCSATSAPFTVSTVGIAETAGTGFNVYPNPNNGQFTIQLEGVIGSTTLYTIHDATGRVVKQGSLLSTATVVELPDARAGMYFLQVVQNGVNTTHRIVVAR